MTGSVTTTMKQHETPRPISSFAVKEKIRDEGKSLDLNLSSGRRSGTKEEMSLIEILNDDDRMEMGEKWDEDDVVVQSNSALNQGGNEIRPS